MVQHIAQESLLPPFCGQPQLLGAEHGVEEGEVGGLFVIDSGFPVPLHGDGLDPQPGIHGHGVEQIQLPETVLDQPALEELRIVDVLFRCHCKTQQSAVLCTGQGTGGAAVFVVDGDTVLRRAVDGDGVQMLCHGDPSVSLLRRLYHEKIPPVKFRQAGIVSFFTAPR